jgi:hypothetical protein
MALSAVQRFHASDSICYALLYLDSDWVSNCYAVAKSLMSEFVNLIHVRGFYFSIHAHQR